MKNFDAWLNAAESVKYLDSAVLKDGVYTLSQGGKSLQLMPKDGEVLLWSSAFPTSLKKVVGSGAEKVLPRLVVSFFSGLGDASFKGPDNRTRVYRSVGIFPSRVVSGKVEFSDHAGRRWVCQSSNVPNVTLAFYKLLYDGNCDMSALLLPMLKPRDSVKVFSNAGSGEDDFIISSVEDFEWVVPNLREYLMFPKPNAVPDYGTAIVSGLVVTPGDREFVEQANAGTERFFVDLLGLNSSRRIRSAAAMSEPDIEELALKHRLPEDVAAEMFRAWEGGQSLSDIAEKFRVNFGKLNDFITDCRLSANSSRRIRSGTDFGSLVSSAELMKLKLDESGTFCLDMGHIKDGHEIYSAVKGTCDVGQLLAIGRKGGFSYTDIMSGVDLSESEVKPEFQKFLVSAAKFQPVKDPVVPRKAASWVISGKELEGELQRWGLKNPGGVFSKVDVLGVDLDGASKFPVPADSSRSIRSGVDEPDMLRRARRLTDIADARERERLQLEGLNAEPDMLRRARRLTDIADARVPVDGANSSRQRSLVGFKKPLASGKGRIRSDFQDDDYFDEGGEEFSEPQEGDIVVNESRGISEVGGRWFEDFEDWDQASRVIKEKMDLDGFYPNVWLEDDHGGHTLTSIDSAAHRGIKSGGSDFVGKGVLVRLGEGSNGGAPLSGEVVEYRPETGQIKVRYDDGYDGVFDIDDPRVLIGSGKGLVAGEPVGL
jgi:hypothetical protein